MRDDDRKVEDVTDRDLVEKARSGDEAAMGALVRRHLAAAYRVARSLLRDDDSAQDAVQDAFLKAFASLEGFRGEASFRTWLLTITANECRGALRRLASKRETALEDVAPVRAPGTDPAEAAVGSIEARRARAMMEKLPEKQRLSVALRIDEGLSFREIGDVIGSSEGAARVNYFHGIRRLRELME